MIATTLVGIIRPDVFYHAQEGLAKSTFINLGWLFNLVTFSVMFICFYFGLSARYGSVIIGGKDATPTIGYWNWFAISLTAGIGVGILFWGTAEPLYHFNAPPAELGLTPGTERAAVYSIASVLQQWTFAPYALYAICGLAVAHSHYNLKRPFRLSSTLPPIPGHGPSKFFAGFIDALCIFAIAGVLAAILGEGVLQLASGIEKLFNVQSGPTVWIILVCAITATYVISSYTGLKKGIRVLSSLNTKIFIFLMIYVLVLGPTAFIFNLGTQATGDFIDTFASRYFWVSPMDGSSWPQDWPLFEWSLWMANAPIIGMFLARLSRGRTIREFMTMNLLVPALFGMLWFWIFGGSAIFLDWNSSGELWKIIQSNGVEASLFAFLEYFPFSTTITAILLVAIFLSFTTLADSLTSTISSLTVHQQDDGQSEQSEEAPGLLKIFWGVLMGVLAILTVTSGSEGGVAPMDAIKKLATLSGVPILFFIIFLTYSTISNLREFTRKENDQ